MSWKQDPDRVTMTTVVSSEVPGIMLVRFRTRGGVSDMSMTPEMAYCFIGDIRWSWRRGNRSHVRIGRLLFGWLVSVESVSQLEIGARIEQARRIKALGGGE